ncbi:tripartite tricarboxylate transporter substrate binding protein [Variovorax sp. Sphag1AA]|uniref:Bug family tripartite tricarboxylate transporter substrate binding protein n=1 Tax=Variovorax sp. Sphag1AA TaxID=2587027 RepID=UPI001620F7BB|nr:tripartite tricarboxylate transporter substrate binding protein [Variovorax sp. Sphag1AA]MBB3180926.1 tripartite-type tricarboxylate transporter receptor subunit TctC [Variovorax sp. Sphag1AA]
MQRRTLLRATGAGLAAYASGAAFAQSFPTRTITLLVPYAAGGNADLTARLFADALSRSIGQPVVVDNRAGGGGAIGANHVIGSRPDGYTLLFSAPSVFSVTPHLVKVNYGMNSIRPVALVSKTPLVLVVKKSSKYKSLADLVQAAKASPGGVAMGYSGLGTPNHLAMLNLESVAQVRFNGIAYKGSGPMLQDMLAGQIEVAADQISTSKPYIESGDLLPIAVFGARMPSLGEVPSVSTLGPEPFDVTTYLGIAAPSATPDAVVAELQKATAKALEDERFKAGMSKLGVFVQNGTGQDYDRLMRNENDFMAKMVASGRVKPE